MATEFNADGAEVHKECATYAPSSKAKYQRMIGTMKRNNATMQDIQDLNPIVAGFYRFWREFFGGSTPEFIGYWIALGICWFICTLIGKLVIGVTQ